MTTPSTSCGAWPCTTRTRSSPGSSTGKADAHPEDCHTPPLESKAYATTGKSTATNQTTNPRKDPYSPWPTPPPNSVSHRPPCTAGWATGSSPADRKSTRRNSSHGSISYAGFCLKKKKQQEKGTRQKGGACREERKQEGKRGD